MIYIYRIKNIFRIIPQIVIKQSKQSNKVLHGIPLSLVNLWHLSMGGTALLMLGSHIRAIFYKHYDSQNASDRRTSL